MGFLLIRKAADAIVAPVEPLWYQNSTANRWKAHAGARLDDVDPCPGGGCPYSGNEGFAGVVTNYSGAAILGTKMVIPASGGHAGYGSNAALALEYLADALEWARETEPSTSLQNDVAYFADGKPSPRHLYKHLCGIPSGITNGGRVFAPFASSVWGNAVHPKKAMSYVPGSGAYDPANTFPDFPGNNDYPATVEWDPVTELVWIKEDCMFADGGMYTFDPATKTYSSRLGFWIRQQGHNNCAIDWTRRIYLVINSGGLFAIDMDAPGDGDITINTTGASLPTVDAPGLVYDDVEDKFFVWGGGATILELTPGANWRTDTWTVATRTNVGGGDTPTAATAETGTYGRFNIVRDLRCRSLVVVNAVNQAHYTYKLAA